MAEFKHLSGDMIRELGLKYEPVGVELYRHDDTIPGNIPFRQENLKSYCQALVMAGEGQTLLLRREQMGCKLGTSVLGFEEKAEDLLDDGAYEKFEVGLFVSEEASAATMLNSTYLPKGATRAALVAPLSFFERAPQVVVFSADSEQVMWLLYALNYETGGRIDLPQSGGALGGCADITAWPLITGKANVTFLGLGCRLKSALDPCHLMIGMPGGMLEKCHANLSKMSKPMAMLRKTRNT